MPPTRQSLPGTNGQQLPGTKPQISAHDEFADQAACNRKSWQAEGAAVPKLALKQYFRKPHTLLTQTAARSKPGNQRRSRRAMKLSSSAFCSCLFARAS